MDPVGLAALWALGLYGLYLLGYDEGGTWVHGAVASVIFAALSLLPYTSTPPDPTGAAVAVAFLVLSLVLTLVKALYDVAEAVDDVAQPGGG